MCLRMEAYLMLPATEMQDFHDVGATVMIL